jgi:hypothetical protein
LRVFLLIDCVITVTYASAYREIPHRSGWWVSSVGAEIVAAEGL